jgi:hypothetical protein
VPESIALGLFAISFVGLNLMHMGATWTRVYVRPGWRINPRERLLVPAGLAAFALCFEAIGGGALLLALQYFLSFHHALMQNYGLARASQRRSGRDVTRASISLHARCRARHCCTEQAPYAGSTRALGSRFRCRRSADRRRRVLARSARSPGEWRAYRAGPPSTRSRWSFAARTRCGPPSSWEIQIPPSLLYALASGHYAQYIYCPRRGDALDGHWRRTRAGVRASMHRPSRHQNIARSSCRRSRCCSRSPPRACGRRRCRRACARRCAAITPAAAMIGVNYEHYWLDRRIWRTPRPASPRPDLQGRSALTKRGRRSTDRQRRPCGGAAHASGWAVAISFGDCGAASRARPAW